MNGMNKTKTVSLGVIAAIVLSMAFALERAHGHSTQLPVSVPTAVKFANGEDAIVHQVPQQVGRQPVDTHYRGTSVEVHPKATGAMLQLQRRVAALLAQHDFLPADRMEHFQWVRNLGGTIIGWRGTITQVSEVEGTIVVQVTLNAIQTTGACVHNSNIYEYYAFDGNQLHYIKSEADMTSPKIMTFN
jgi:hypothetical protein